MTKLINVYCDESCHLELSNKNQSEAGKQKIMVSPKCRSYSLGIHLNTLNIKFLNPPAPFVQAPRYNVSPSDNS